MKIAITGSSGLARAIADVMYDAEFTHFRIGEHVGYDFDVFINLAHQEYAQVDLLDEWVTAWWDRPNCMIVNISSRAAFPNISKGYMYAAQKAALNHSADNYTFNSECRCRITTLNLGLLESELPSLSYYEVARILRLLIILPAHIEVPAMTLQHRFPYSIVQQAKANEKRHNIH